MLPGLIPQINLNWDPAINYYLPTLKRVNNKIYQWFAPSGPQFGGAKQPGTPEGGPYWGLIEDNFDNFKYVETGELNWNSLTWPAKFFILSQQNLTAGAPLNITAWWWLEVNVCYSSWGTQVLQEARLHSTNPDVATILNRVCSNGAWGVWSYPYAQYSG